MLGVELELGRRWIGIVDEAFVEVGCQVKAQKVLITVFKINEGQVLLVQIPIKYVILLKVIVREHHFLQWLKNLLVCFD